MFNINLSKAFDLMADLLEIQGENRFRINAYRRTARTIKDLLEDIVLVAEEDRLEQLSGVGKGIAEKIRQYLEDERIDELEKLRKNMPSGLPALLNVPGLGPKKVAAVWKQLGVENLDDLKEAIDSGRLAELSGFGKQSVKKIADGIAFMEKSGQRVPYGGALPLAEELADKIRSFKGVGQVAIAGSLRRGKETIGDIDLLCSAQDGSAVVKSFVELEEVGRVLARGDTKGSVTLPFPEDREVQVDLRVVPGDSFGAAWQYFTGSKEHNVRLRELAIKKGFKLNEWGLFKGETQVAGGTEEGIYSKLGLPFIPAELREDRGEFDCDEKFLDSLVTLEDIKGELHIHTPASDGRSTLQEMAQAAKAIGFEYLNVADHSKSSAIAGGLSIERMERQLEEVREFDKKFKGLKILVGCECDILASGDLDYPDELLAECDFVVASIHFAGGQDRQKITRRTIKAVENPHVHILGHPTGRLLGRRAPSDIDMAEVVKVAADTGTALEINAAWRRLDLKDLHVRLAMEAGAWLTINTDAHEADLLGNMRYGVATARRGWATADRVINTFSLKELMNWKKRIAK